MAAKSKASNNKDANSSFLDSNKNAELEKKVDALLSIEEPVESRDTETKPVEVESTAATPSTEPIEEVAGVPLLPSDKLPDIAVETPKEPEQPKAKFYESIGPKPIAPEKIKESPIIPVKDDLGLEDVSTSKAVDEIIAAEADELLDVRDRRYASEPVVADKKKSRNIFGRILRSKKFWGITFLLLFLGVGAAATVPTSRYYALNAAGVRSATSVTVLDETTGQPIKNADFSVAGTTGKTDKEGVARLDGLKLGPQTISIKKAAYAEFTRPVTLGWGSNPLGDFKLKPVGSQFKITVVDFLSKKPILKAEAVSGESSAQSNEKGEIVIAVPRSDVEKESIDFELRAEGLRTEKLTIAIGDKESTIVEMVSARKHVFITKRSGTYDVYKVDIDGKNEEKVLTGTGSERPESIALSLHPTKNLAALVSTRDRLKNKSGATLSTLTMINLDDNKMTQATQSERVQMLGWVNDKLMYVKIAEGTNTESIDRHRLVAYSTTSASERELASSNYFNDVMLVNGSVYYTPAAFNVNGVVGLYKTNADGNEKRTIYDKEVWNIFRTSFDELSVSMGQEWFTLNLDNDVLTRATSAPPVMASRVYVPNSDGSQNLWTEERDGKGVLLNYEKANKAEKVLQSKGGIKNPLRWLDDSTIIYRISNNQETADYVMSTSGGEPRKVRDVTDTAGIDRWYYY